jgi:acyl carrier protein
MKTSLRVLLALLLFAASSFAASSREAVVERVRAELAKVLKVEPAKLPIEKPVVQLGADDLHFVEWAMAVEKSLGVYIPEEKFVDPKSKSARKDFSIGTMAALVSEELQKKKSK